MSRIAVRGVHLNAEVSGEGPALLLLHGFTGNASTWAPHLATWRGYRTIAVDLLGHGHSDCPSDPRRYAFAHAVRDLVALLDDLGIGPVAVLGYSMGGRLALHLALDLLRTHPARLRALVLESTSPGIQDAAERQARAESDAVLAASIERDGIAAFVARWEALPFFATQARLPGATREALRRQRLAQRPEGLANSLRGSGSGQQEFLLPRLATIGVPVLLLVGALDRRYQGIARQMATTLPAARVEAIADAGHAIHLEQPAAFAGAVKRFLDGCLHGNHH